MSFSVVNLIVLVTQTISEFEVKREIKDILLGSERAVWPVRFFTIKIWSHFSIRRLGRTKGGKLSVKSLQCKIHFQEMSKCYRIGAQNA